jgi:hypothetical protein
MISVSVVPGGNPTALADPERFATIHRACTSCGNRFCDRCIGKNDVLLRGTCSSCGAKLADPPADEALKIIFGEKSAEGAVATVRLEPPSAKPWWKFW